MAGYVNPHVYLFFYIHSSTKAVYLIFIKKYSIIYIEKRYLVDIHKQIVVEIKISFGREIAPALLGFGV